MVGRPLGGTLRQWGSKRASNFFFLPKISLLLQGVNFYRGEAYDPCREGLICKVTDKTTYRLRARLLAHGAMEARSAGVDSRNRALRLKGRRKLETESAGRWRHREREKDGRGASDSGGKLFSRWMRERSSHLDATVAA